jgi:hypothetical protein
MNKNSLYSHDTSVIVTSPNLKTLETQKDKIMWDINNLLKINQSVLSYNKAHYLQFSLKSSRDYDKKLNYQRSYVNSSTDTKFLGLMIDDSLSWKSHID